MGGGLDENQHRRMKTVFDDLEATTSAWQEIVISGDNIPETLCSCMALHRRRAVDRKLRGAPQLERAAGGVPMGRILPASASASDERSPRFLVWAEKDPNGGNLDRAYTSPVWYQPQRIPPHNPVESSESRIYPEAHQSSPGGGKLRLSST